MSVARELVHKGNDLNVRVTYSLMTAGGGAIAAAILHTSDDAFGWRHLLWIAAVSFWGASFHAGVKRLEAGASAIMENAEIIKVQTGEIAMRPDDFAELEHRATAYGVAFGRLYRAQLFRLTAGGVAYLAFHLWAMIAGG